jgi:hypothetical protein
MKLLNIVILSTYAIAASAVWNSDFEKNGPHGDGRFLASTIVGGAACANANEFNLLELDSNTGGPKTFDANTDAISNCVACATATFKAQYGAQATEYTGDYISLNRNECCFNDKLLICQEMMRAYQEGCNSGGSAGDNRPLDDIDAAKNCPT